MFRDGNVMIIQDHQPTQIWSDILGNITLFHGFSFLQIIVLFKNQSGRAFTAKPRSIRASPRVGGINSRELAGDMGTIWKQGFVTENLGKKHENSAGLLIVFWVYHIFRHIFSCFFVDKKVVLHIFMDEVLYHLLTC